jgi:hypothetical protein
METTGRVPGWCRNEGRWHACVATVLDTFFSLFFDSFYLRDARVGDSDDQRTLTAVQTVLVMNSFIACSRLFFGSFYLRDASVGDSHDQQT